MRAALLRLAPRPAERAPLAAAAATYFLLLCGYYMLRSLREAMVLQAGSDRIPFFFLITLGAMLLVLPVYWWVVARVSRRRLMACVYAPIIVLFASLAAFASSGHVTPTLGGIYFVSVAGLNLLVISVFWSTMVDLWSPESARRVFGFVAAGGSAGALAGPAFNAFFVEGIGATAVIYVACAFLAAAVLMGMLARNLRARVDATKAGDASVAVGGRAIEDLARLVRSPYLLGIAGLIVMTQLFGAFMYNEQAKYVEAGWSTLTERAAIFARIDLATNVLSLVLQTFLVGWLTARGGVRATLVTMGALVAASFAILVFFPSGALLLVTQVIRRGCDYGLFKPAREMLFTILSPETKFKSKSLIDTVLQRGADSIGNGIYVLVSGLGLAFIAGLCAAACVLLVMAARRLGAAYTDQESRATPSR
ncbi:MAG: MFS transporter [Gammaproteobacteria bacterium]